MNSDFGYCHKQRLFACLHEDHDQEEQEYLIDYGYLPVYHFLDLYRKIRRHYRIIATSSSSSTQTSSPPKNNSEKGISASIRRSRP